MQVTSSVPIVNDPTVRWIRDCWVTAQSAPHDSTAFGFVSVPFDFAVSHRPGCRFGPEKILSALNTLSAYCVDKRVSLDKASFVECGSVDALHSLEQSYSNIRAAIAALPRRLLPIVLGGDHSITDPAIRGVRDRLSGAPMGLIVFDAHFDSREPIPGKEHSGHWMRTLSDVIDYRKVVQMGINAAIYSEAYMREAEAAGVLVMTPYDIRRVGWTVALRTAIEHASADGAGVYISVDIDGIDQAYAPGTSVPNCGGLLAHEVLDAVFEIAVNAPTLALDITEVSPPLDRDDMTSRLAAQIIMNFMAGVVRQTSSGT